MSITCSEFSLLWNTLSIVSKHPPVLPLLQPLSMMLDFLTCWRQTRSILATALVQHCRCYLLHQELWMTTSQQQYKANYLWLILDYIFSHTCPAYKELCIFERPLHCCVIKKSVHLSYTATSYCSHLVADTASTQWQEFRPFCHSISSQKLGYGIRVEKCAVLNVYFCGFVVVFRCTYVFMYVSEVLYRLRQQISLFQWVQRTIKYLYIYCTDKF